MPVVPCPTPCPPITRGVVQFAQSEFEGAYPEFVGRTLASEQNAFTVATFMLNNSCASAVQDANQRMVLLYLLTAHVMFLTVGPAGIPPPGIVGRIDSATEGSVTVSAEYSSEVTQSEAYYIQTKYGAQFWQMTASLRTMFYVGAPECGPNGPGFPFDAFPFE